MPWPDFSEITRLAQRSSLVTERLLRCANSPRFGLVQPITSLRHAIVFLGVSEVRRVAESSLLRVDQAHLATAPASLAGRRTVQEKKTLGKHPSN